MTANATPAGQTTRRIVFISHGNPQDNDFTTWLGSRLTAAGYEIWTDLTRLLGGEEMWQDIDQAIRRNAAKVVVVLSKAGIEKSGVRTEIAIAVATGKKLGDDHFLIPIKIDDDLAYDEVLPQFMGRTIIGFSGNWAQGLARLHKVLDRAGIPRDDRPSAAAMRKWQLLHAARGRLLESAEEPLQSNWHPLRTQPRTISFYEIGRPLNTPSEAQDIAKAISWPAAAHRRLICSFATLDELAADLLATTPLKPRASVPLARLLTGDLEEEDPTIEPKEARKLYVNLLRQGFDRFAAGRGLKPAELSGTSKAWWVPKDLIPDDRVTFRRPDGSAGWRKLVGRDNTRGLFWHFGVTAAPVLFEPARFVFRPHVIFTRDGQTSEGAQWRRAVCKMWFNARWRDLLLAYASVLGGDSDAIEIPMGGEGIVSLSRFPLFLTSPVRIADDQTAPVAHDPNAEGDIDDDDGTGRLDDPAFLDDEPEEEDPAGDDDQ